MVEALGAAILAALVAPHLAPQSRLAPASGIALWLSVLALRAVLTLSLVIIAVLFVPATQLFELLTQWCFHAVIPFIATHLGFDGHQLGDAAMVVPASVLAASLLSAGFGVWRGTRAVRSWLRRSSLGPGPGRSVIVGDRQVVVAAAGLCNPKVVVASGALFHLDDDELAASLEHEWGHVARRHRFISLLGQLLRGVSRLLPGGRQALGRLEFHLERDADEYAVRRTQNPLALASAICKASVDAAPPQPAVLANLGGCGVPERLRLLAAGPRAHPRPLATGLARLLAVGATALTLTLAFSAPTLARTGLDQLAKADAAANRDCQR